MSSEILTLMQLSLPTGLNPGLPFKIFTHGFDDNMTQPRYMAFVDAWMQSTGRAVNVILVNWPQLAAATQFTNLDNYGYDMAARNALDTGAFLGLCLAALSQKVGAPAADLHLLGHSLGAHLMGKAGRVYTATTGHLVARITGLDPAGPRFVAGPVLPALPELNAGRLTATSAGFVDVIHTNGALQPAAVSLNPSCGDLHQLGSMDFYPSGGFEQTGCQLGGEATL